MAAMDFFFVVGLARHAKTHVQPLLYTTAALTFNFFFSHTFTHCYNTVAHTYALPFTIRMMLYDVC